MMLIKTGMWDFFKVPRPFFWIDVFLTRVLIKETLDIIIFFQKKNLCKEKTIGTVISIEEGKYERKRFIPLVFSGGVVSYAKANPKIINYYIAKFEYFVDENKIIANSMMKSLKEYSVGNNIVVNYSKKNNSLVWDEVGANRSVEVNVILKDYYFKLFLMWLLVTYFVLIFDFQILSISIF